MVIGREGCREGDIEDESGDETRGRFVLIASDMIRVVSERISRGNCGCGSAMRPRECVGIWRGGAGVRESRKEGLEQASATFIKECVLVAVPSPHFVGVRVPAVGVLDRNGKPGPPVASSTRKNRQPQHSNSFARHITLIILSTCTFRSSMSPSRKPRKHHLIYQSTVLAEFCDMTAPTWHSTPTDSQSISNPNLRLGVYSITTELPCSLPRDCCILRPGSSHCAK